MKTTFDEIDIVINNLMASPLKDEISGVICRKRPAGSVKEDIVVNALFLLNGQLQPGVVNVNIHVPNLKIKKDGVQDNSQPDMVRLKQLTDMAISALDNKWGAGYNYSVQQQNLIEDASDYFSNIRIEFVFVNVN